MPLAIDPNGEHSYFYEAGSSGPVSIVWNNVAIAGSPATKAVAVSASSNKIAVRLVTSDFAQNILGILKYRSTGAILGTRHDGSVFATFGSNVQLERGFTLEGQRFDNIPAASMGTNVARWNCGDWNIRPGSDLQPGKGGPIRVVTAPCPGYSRSGGGKVASDVSVQEGSSSIRGLDPSALEIRPNDNIVIAGAGPSGSSLNAMVTAVDYKQKIVSISPAPATSVQHATVSWQTPTFTDFGLDSTRSATRPTRRCADGEIVWNASPAAGQPTGWFCNANTWNPGPPVGYP
jgi:hypothetical protein